MIYFFFKQDTEKKLFFAHPGHLLLSGLRGWIYRKKHLDFNKKECPFLFSGVRI